LSSADVLTACTVAVLLCCHCIRPGPRSSPLTLCVRVCARLCICVCVCMYMCVCVCVCVCVYVYVECVWKVFMYVSILVRVYTCLCLGVYVCVHVCMVSPPPRWPVHTLSLSPPVLASVPLASAPAPVCLPGPATVYQQFDNSVTKV
jgi:hypothetical protein